jgi:hypothetical protein
MRIRRVVGMQNGHTSYNGRPLGTAGSGVCSLDSRDDTLTHVIVLSSRDSALLT